MTADFKKYVKALAKACKEETYHAEYTLRFEWEAEPDSEDCDSAASYLQVQMNTTYLWAQIHVYPAFFRQYVRKDFEGCGRDMLHEICHLFIEPVSDLFVWDASPSQSERFSEVIERQTQRICHTVFDLMPKNWYTPTSLGLV